MNEYEQRNAPNTAGLADVTECGFRSLVADDDEYTSARAAIGFWTARANALFAGGRLQAPVVRFDLRGRAAGMTVYPRHRHDPVVVRLNPELLCSDPEDMIEETVPHELAHVAVRRFYGARVKPHGPEWRAVMQAFGKQPRVCHALPTRPARRLRYYPYACGCAEIQHLSAIRHRRARSGRQRYRCLTCGSDLAYTGALPSHGNPADRGAG